MIGPAQQGFSLLELLVSLAIAAIASALVLPGLLDFQAHTLAEIQRDELHKRAARLLRYLVADLQETALQVGPEPKTAAGGPPILVHDSLAGDPAESFSSSLRPEPGAADEHDALTILTAVSFAPPIFLTQPTAAGGTTLALDRRPNRAPGSSREIQPSPEAIDHVVLPGHRTCYRVTGDDQSLPLAAGLLQTVPAGTEVMGVRARRYELQSASGTNRLYRDDFTRRDILDHAVDGLQFEYLLQDDTLVDQPDRPAEVRGIRISLLVRSRHADRDFVDRNSYRLGDRTYGPYHDHFRRTRVSRMVEIINHGLP
ncbi:MAG TPA: prepilin-type N-terminal cleavage/methylation domain-containing protein [Desulfuromonadales bacterium]|nr:prepilin-type N-terminal cleavage/methylation domain-containing protein [Desulfuromonadales bacterium]